MSIWLQRLISAGITREHQSGFDVAELDRRVCADDQGVEQPRQALQAYFKNHVQTVVSDARSDRSK